MRIAAVLCASALLGVNACGSSAKQACVSVPQTIPNASLVTSGSKLTVHVGATVYVVLVEPASSTDAPGFPWLTPTASDPTVLTPVRLCKRVRASSLPLSVTGFRAVHPGTAILNARLAPRWRSLKTTLRDSRSTITVTQ